MRKEGQSGQQSETAQVKQAMGSCQRSRQDCRPSRQAAREKPHGPCGPGCQVLENRRQCLALGYGCRLHHRGSFTQGCPSAAPKILLQSLWWMAQALRLFRRSPGGSKMQPRWSTAGLPSLPKLQPFTPTSCVPLMCPIHTPRCLFSQFPQPGKPSQPASVLGPQRCPSAEAPVGLFPVLAPQH